MELIRSGANTPPQPKPAPAPRPTVPVHDMPPPNAGGPKGGSSVTAVQKLAPLSLPGAPSTPKTGHAPVANFKDPRITRGPQDPKVASPAQTIPAEIVRRAQIYGIPANLALAVAHVESGFSQGAVSSAGAIGVMQLEPGTAAELGVNPYNWRQNIDGGVRYLAEKIKQYHGNVNLALQAYNGGDGNVGSAATQHYAQLVQGTRQQIKSGQLKVPAAAGDRGFYTISSPLPVLNPVTPHGARVDSSTGLGDFHNGVDLAAPQGTAVHAMIGGKVIINSSNPNGAGNYLVIQDPAGREWYYMHLAGRPNIKLGTKVQAGDRIGAVGMTGLTTGPHLHVALKVPQLGVAEKLPAAKAALQFASTQLGTPYVWGGEAPKKGFDCSGLIQWAYDQIGVHLPRTTYDQVKVGKPVGLHDLKPGDLVFLEPQAQGPGHVVMYAGNGRVIVAPHTGTDVQYQKLSVALGDGFVAARRILRAVDGPKAWADPTDILTKAGKVGWNNTARVYAPAAVPGGVVSANAPVSGPGSGSGASGQQGSGADSRFGEDVTPYATSPVDTNDVANDALGQAQAPTNVLESLAASGPISPETAALLAAQQQTPTLPAAVQPSGSVDQMIPPPPSG